MKYINGMRRYILAGDTCITHNGDAGTNFFILPGPSL